ncbi:hypothetical protein BT93_F2895 [Corymbia citriodora subsp. variegata]|nr:hypothetical protein BT93_F2895 [Corymbia citriodora subsp. variegata]
MALQAKQSAVHGQKGTVHVRTQGCYGGDGVQMTSRGRFLRDHPKEMGWGNCFAVQAKGIKANGVVTTVEGLDGKLKHDVILSDLKKKLRCKGDKYRTEQAGVVIQLNTNHAEAVKDFLWKNGLAAKDKVNCTSRV